MKRCSPINGVYMVNFCSEVKTIWQKALLFNVLNANHRRGRQ